VRLALHAADHGHRFSEVSLCVSRRMLQRNEHLPLTQLSEPHVVLHNRVAARVAVLVTQAFEDPFGRVALFFAAGLVFFQNLVDGSDPGVQLGPARGLLATVAGGTAYRSIFRTVSRASPNSLAASRSLILSTTTARRTRA
jgi:hypothetical protein